MIRKQTWLLMGIFAALVGLAFYLRENPIEAGVSATPSPTALVTLLEGWQSGEIVWISLSGPDSQAVELSRSGAGQWQLEGEAAQAVDAGTVELAAAQIAAIRVMNTIDQGYDRQALGLDDPRRVLSIRDSQGREARLRFGALTPTGNGYYVQRDDDLLCVVSKNGAEAIFEQLDLRLLAPAAATPGTPDS